MFFINFDFQHFNTVSHPKNRQCSKQNISNPTNSIHIHQKCRFHDSVRHAARTHQTRSPIPVMDSFLGRRRSYEQSGRCTDPRAHWRANRASGTKIELQEAARDRQNATRSLDPVVGVSSFPVVSRKSRQERGETQHWRTRCLFAGGTFSSDSQWPAACRTCRRACASLRSRAAVADWPSIDRSYTRFDSRAFREGGWSRVGDRSQCSRLLEISAIVHVLGDRLLRDLRGWLIFEGDRFVILDLI